MLEVTPDRMIVVVVKKIMSAMVRATAARRVLMSMRGIIAAEVRLEKESNNLFMTKPSFALGFQPSVEQ